MSSCQDEQYPERKPADFDVGCFYCGVVALRSTMQRVNVHRGRTYICTDLVACKVRFLTAQPITKIKIDTSDPETKKIWEAALAAKREVEGWPAWKQGHLVREEVESDFNIDRCDACGFTGMQQMSGCKMLCRRCGFNRTCNDTV